MDYSEMYRILFQAQTNAIKILQGAQRKTEEIFINEQEKYISIVENDDSGDVSKPKKNHKD
ncbi:MAG: hypothetical protein LBR98_07170 [Syntrophomonadaceae bacterium]|jgi:hypothetical protein|nr:hypothetical protein [Syntrophomonadaceae bacterium]